MSARGFHGIRWNILALVAVLLLALTGSLYHTYEIVQNRKADAVILDLAGRQRMLIERHLKQVLLASQGFFVDHRETGELLLQRIEVLMKGGRTIREIGEQTIVVLPPAQTPEIRAKFREQKDLLQEFLQKEWVFLDEPRDTQEAIRDRAEIVRLNEVLIRVANEAVSLMSQHSESKIAAIIRWDVGGAVIAGVFGLFLAAQLWTTQQRLQKEISERHLAQQQALQALRQSDDLKTALLSSVSHELRSPLAAIQSLISGVEDASGEVRREMVGGVREEVGYLSHLVDNLLDMSRVDAGALHPHREWHLLEELIEAAIRRLGSSLSERQLHISIAEDLPTVWVDATEMHMVLVNLLDNAVKFSDKGSIITLQAARHIDMVEICVTNVGQQIASDDLDRIFDRFYRTEQAIANGIPGTGLGLAICKAIVQAHKGRIHVVSHEGKTTVCMYLPLGEPDSTPRTLPNAHGGRA